MIHHLGILPYLEALKVMNEKRNQRLSGQISDEILFLEHPPVITMGRRFSKNDLHVSKEELLKKGIDFIETDRGGRLTYHGPGQLVGYFIVYLEERSLSIGDMVWKTEEGIRLLLKEYGIEAVRDARNPGLWVDNLKISSLGFHVHRGVTTHGMSLNISNDLKPYTYFIPCGVEGGGVTSFLQLKGEKIALKELSSKLADYYQLLFQKS